MTRLDPATLRAVAANLDKAAIEAERESRCCPFHELIWGSRALTIQEIATEMRQKALESEQSTQHS